MRSMTNENDSSVTTFDDVSPCLPSRIHLNINNNLILPSKRRLVQFQVSPLIIVKIIHGAIAVTH